MNNYQKISIVLLFAVISQSCNNGKAESHQTKKTEENYTLVTLESRETNSVVKLPGVLQPFEYVQIFPKLSGFIKNVNVDRGSKVTQGQILLTLEAPEIDEHVAAARLKYTEMNAVYMTSRDRYNRLMETS